jgi:alpha-glucuronidase
MKRVIIMKCQLLAFLVLMAPGTSFAVEITFEAMKDWSVVVAGDATVSERYAGEEFQSLLRQLTGLDLPIVDKAHGQSKNVFIGLGAAATAGDLGFDASGMGEESLRIRVDAKNIVIAGGRPRGTLYGVYEFFERYCGVRFSDSGPNPCPRSGPATTA